eukprot:m.207883 g.207883  ORF g.207883 m.207883 type:complete len:166 (+) comp15034_c0_seq1:241-738(+)
MAGMAANVPGEDDDVSVDVLRELAKISQDTDPNPWLTEYGIDHGCTELLTLLDKGLPLTVGVELYDILKTNPERCFKLMATDYHGTFFARDNRVLWYKTLPEHLVKSVLKKLKPPPSVKDKPLLTRFDSLYGRALNAKQQQNLRNAKRSAAAAAATQPTKSSKGK